MTKTKKRKRTEATPLNTIVPGMFFLFLPYLVSMSMVNIASYSAEGIYMAVAASGLLLLLGSLYPSMAALRRGHARKAGIVAVNLAGVLIFLTANSSGLFASFGIIVPRGLAMSLAFCCWAIALIAVAIPPRPVEGLLAKQEGE